MVPLELKYYTQPSPNPGALALQDVYGIGRGEAAALAFARRIGATAVFLSSDGKAVRVARGLGAPSRDHKRASGFLAVRERVKEFLEGRGILAALDGFNVFCRKGDRYKAEL